MNYPDWQKFIRAAQEDQATIKSQARAREEEAKRLEDLERAKNLKVALSWFGIESDPVSNGWIQDEYYFWLETKEPYAFSTTDDYIYFQLRFCVYADRERLVVNIPTSHSVMVNAYPLVDTDPRWREVRAELADKLDMLDKATARDERLAESVADLLGIIGNRHSHTAPRRATRRSWFMP